MHEAGLRLEAGNHEDLGGRTHPFSLGSSGAEDLFDLALDLLEVHELSINGREAYVRNLVQVAQAVHDHLADLSARDLDTSGAPELRLDVVDDRAQPLGRDVPLLRRLLEPGEQLLRVEVLGAELRPFEARPAADLLLGLGLGLAAEPGGDDRDLDLALHGVVTDDAEDDVGAGVSRRAHDLGRLLHLLQGYVLAGGDVEQDALGAVDRRFQQRAGDGLLGGVLGARVAGPVTDAHERLAGVLHDRLHVGEVEVDDARLRNEVGDALDALAEHVVRHPEGFLERRFGARHLGQPVVRDDDQRVDLAAQGLDPFLGGVVADAAFEGEWPRHHADRQRPGFLRQLGDDGGRTGARAAAHAGGDEHHVGFLDHSRKLGPALVGGVAAARPVATRAEAAGDLVAHLDLHVGLAAFERLLVGIDGDELHLERFRDHAIDGVAATATAADDLDARSPLMQLTFFHDVLLVQICFRYGELELASGLFSRKNLAATSLFSDRRSPAAGRCCGLVNAPSIPTSQARPTPRTTDPGRGRQDRPHRWAGPVAPRCRRRAARRRSCP